MNASTRLQTWLPRAAGFLLQRLPSPLIHSALTPILQTLESHMQDDDWALVQDRWFEVRCKDMQASWFAVARGNHWQVMPEHRLTGVERPVAHVRIQGNLQAFADLLDANIDPESLFFQRALTIQGDTELGYWLKAMLDRVDRDALPAWIKTTVRGIRQWQLVGDDHQEMQHG